MQKNRKKATLGSFGITLLAAFVTVFALFNGFAKGGDKAILIGVLIYIGGTIAYFVYAFSRIEMHYKSAGDYSTTTTTYTWDEQQDTYVSSVKTPTDKANSYNAQMKFWLGVLCWFFAPIGFLIFAVIFAIRALEDCDWQAAAKVFVVILMTVCVAGCIFLGYWLPFGKKQHEKAKLPVSRITVSVSGGCFNPFHTHSFTLSYSYVQEDGQTVSKSKDLSAESSGVSTTYTFTGDFTVSYSVSSMKNCHVSSGAQSGTLAAGESLKLTITKD